MGDLVRINGKVYTRSRAIAIGLIKPDGTPKPVVAILAVAAAAASSLPAPKKGRGRPAGSKNRPKTSDEVPTTEDGRLISRKKIKPLVPQNVENGVPITDDETLAEIVARTAEIEAARVAGTPPQQTS